LFRHTRRRQPEQLWDRGEVPVGGPEVDVAEIGGQMSHLPLNVYARTIPGEQRPHGEAVPEIVESWPRTVFEPAQAGLVHEQPKGSLSCPPRDPGALLGNEPSRGLQGGEYPVPVQMEMDKLGLETQSPELAIGDRQR